MRCVRVVGACLMSALLIAGCAQDATESAESQDATTAQPDAPPVSPEKLNAGRFSTKPLAPLGKAGSPERGATIEAQRMADHVVGPWEVDEALIDPYLDTYYVMNSPAPLTSLGPEAVAQVAAKHRMVNGFGSARRTAEKANLLNVVLRFPDDAAAATASGEMNDAASAGPIAGQQPEPLPIAGHDGTAASTYSFKERATVRAFTAHGPFVFMQFAQSSAGRDAVVEMIAKAIDLQTPLIDGFTPTNVDSLADVEVDPTGLLAKTLPVPGEEASPIKNAVYGPRGASHFQSNPVGSTTLFDDTGVTAVAMAGANIYEARDNPTARFITNAFNGEVTKMEGTTAAAPVPEIPDSHCTAFPQTFYCVAPANNYAIEIRGQKFEDVQQQVAAQYIILTAK